jgi:5-methylcytosine-specific restriction endonuclease McrA
VNRRAAYLVGASCVRCGATGRLEADHIDPTTKVSSSFWTWPEPEFQAEWAKCQWLCRKCHGVKTAHDRRLALGAEQTPVMRKAFAWLRRNGFMTGKARTR